MNVYSLNDRILGCLIGAGAGDAMGAATESRTTEQILQYFGHKVTDFEVTPMDTFAKGNQPGQATDDFSSAYFITRHIIDHDGEITSEVVKEALIDWSEHPIFFDRFAGPTTRMAIRRYKGEEIPESDAIQLLPRQATNGAAMKIAPIGLFNPGNVDQAIYDAAVVTMVTHDNYLAISGGSAVAAAVAEEKMVEIAERIGMGLHVAEAIPSAFGFFAAGSGNPMDAIIGAVNAGYDTDTVATMAGAMAGALSGSAAFPEHFLPTMEKINGFEIRKTADDVERIAGIRQKRGEQNVR